MLEGVLQRFVSQAHSQCCYLAGAQGNEYYGPTEQVGPMEPFIGGFFTPRPSPSPSPIPPPIPPKDGFLYPMYTPSDTQSSDGLLSVGLPRPHVPSQHPMHHLTSPPRAQLTVATEQLTHYTAVERSQMFRAARMEPHLQARNMSYGSHSC